MGEIPASPLAGAPLSTPLITQLPPAEIEISPTNELDPY